MKKRVKTLAARGTEPCGVLIVLRCESPFSCVSGGTQVYRFTKAQKQSAIQKYI